MRHQLAPLLVAVTLALPAAPAHGAAVDALAWLAGCWEGEGGGGKNQECWMAPEGGIMLGVSRVISDQSTMFEFLRIAPYGRAGGLAYLASPRGKEPTAFELVESGEGMAVFANPEHDFPQRITYRRDGDALTARVEARRDGEWGGFDIEWRRVSGGWPAAAGHAPGAAAIPTPSTGRGPFFPVDFEAPADNDLRSVEAGSDHARGVPLRIEGRVVDGTGSPVAGVEVLLWQVDAGGNYNHPDEAKSRIKEPGDGEIDPNFQYRGKTSSDETGAFVFETIVPAHYRAMETIRPNHVHFEFRHPDFRRLATEMNFRGDPNFEGDFVTSGFTAEQLAALQVDLEPLDPSRDDGARLARWTVVLSR